VISTRYARPALALLLLALLPTVANVYLAPAPLPKGGLASVLPSAGARDGTRKPGWVETHFGTVDYVSRRFGDLELFAARTHDGKRVFHYPELALTYGHACTAERTARVRTPAGDLPVRVLEFRTEGSLRLAACALAYGGRPVAAPLPFLARELPRMLVRGREPMTLLYVQGDAPASGAADLEAHILALLGEAWTALARDHDPS
jgi:hypothetical protein